MAFLLSFQNEEPKFTFDCNQCDFANHYILLYQHFYYGQYSEAWLLLFFFNFNILFSSISVKTCYFSMLSLRFMGRDLRKCLALAQRLNLRPASEEIPSTKCLESLHPSFSKYPIDEELIIWKKVHSTLNIMVRQFILILNLAHDFCSLILILTSWHILGWGAGKESKHFYVIVFE